jgi:hypothetical protein
LTGRVAGRTLDWKHDESADETDTRAFLAALATKLEGALPA